MTDLDSFFAMKDRKKTAQRRIQKPAALPLEGQGETKRQVEKKTEEEDEEWKSFDAEKKDYSGLKIQPLQLVEEGNGGDEEEKGSEPWKMKISVVQSGIKSIHEKPPLIYVNPRERELSREMTSTQEPPDVKNSRVFPSLAEAGQYGLGLRTNQSVWNRRTVAGQEGQVQSQPVQVCRLEKCPTEESIFPTRGLKGSEGAWSEGAWRPALEVRRDGASYRENTVDKWRCQSEENRSWRQSAQSQLLRSPVENSTHTLGRKSAGNRNSPLKEPTGPDSIGNVARYIPPSMRRKLAS